MQLLAYTNIRMFRHVWKAEEDLLKKVPNGKLNKNRPSGRQIQR